MTIRQRAHNLLGQLPDESVEAVVAVMTKMVPHVHVARVQAASAARTAERPLWTTLEVLCEWDSEAEVWCATSDDIPGLVLEDSDRATLEARVRDAAPELLHLNQMPRQNYILSFRSKEPLLAYG